MEKMLKRFLIQNKNSERSLIPAESRIQGLKGGIKSARKKEADFLAAAEEANLTWVEGEPCPGSQVRWT